MEIAAFKDYRDFLRRELEDRVARNKSYSLRAFAKQLGLSPQMLSFVLNKKKNLSSSKAAEVADFLGLEPDETRVFLDLIGVAGAKSEKSKSLIEKRLRSSDPVPDYALIEDSKFKIISDWHHYAILELTQTKRFKSDRTWIAKRLGITRFEVDQAVDRLKLLELLVESSTGVLKRTELNQTASCTVPNAALRKLARQYLEKSVAALEEQSIDERDITNITMSIDPKKLPDAKKMIKNFRRKLSKFLEAGERTEVYVFAPTLIKLTKNMKEK